MVRVLFGAGRPVAEDDVDEVGRLEQVSGAQGANYAVEVSETVSNPHRGASTVSLIAGVVMVATPVIGWLGRADFARTLMGVIVTVVIGAFVGLLGPGIATSLARLLGPVIRPVLVLAAVAFVGWAVVGLVRGDATVTKTISLTAAAVLVAAWVPLTRLSGR